MTTTDENPQHAADPASGLLDRWRQTEPLRLWLYGIAVPLLLALVGYGLLTDHYAALWLAVLQAALLGGGTEAARQFVVSPATARAAAREAVEHAEVHTGPDYVDAGVRYAMVRFRIPR